MNRVLLIATLLVGTACTAQTNPASPNAQQPGAAAETPTMPQPPGATDAVPNNAPKATVANVPATTGRANLADSKPPFAITTLGTFDSPFAMAFLPDGRLLVTEKGGTLKLRETDGGIVGVAGVPAVETGGQGGLLDVAVAPDVADSGVVYLSYAESGAGGPALALAKGRLVSKPVTCVRAPCYPVVSLEGVQVIWRSGSNGPGGQFGSVIAFAPDGKSLFLTSGERQRFTPAQDPGQALGKIVHLTLDGKAAADNPAYARGGVEAMTWSSGHRNPYGLVFTRDGRLWEEEMGPKGGDELNLIEPAKNYGWPIVSNGDNYSGQPIPDQPSRPDLAEPVLWWNPVISPGGMIEYTGAMFPEYKGSLLIGALSAKALIRVALDGAKATAVDQWAMGARIRDVAQAPDGAIWVLEDGGRGSNGALLRLAKP
ncbi:PQQ-dependent sugar dehydrogenase [Sphingomonas oligophenolica]|uniref:PQQ-dependent sugar dehydrogenase n=1 Tax=Sphingomonas oligophenolica TaxID=301154 RepID=A0A502CPS4_9SPHN|nr:PQQ-dependent sugar dehydrogenase [Sphingomonas oligophenolica]TPG13711.1 PQQ-dependent sugar dehydrogenase [Sphingomonas oligophenolica]